MNLIYLSVFNFVLKVCIRNVLQILNKNEKQARVALGLYDRGG